MANNWLCKTAQHEVDSLRNGRVRRKKSSKLSSEFHAAKVVAGAPRPLPGRAGSCVEMVSPFSHDLLGRRSLATAAPSFLWKGATMFPTWQIQTGVHLAAARCALVVPKVKWSASGACFPQPSSCHGWLCTCCLALGVNPRGSVCTPAQQHWKQAARRLFRTPHSVSGHF